MLPSLFLALDATSYPVTKLLDSTHSIFSFLAENTVIAFFYLLVNLSIVWLVGLNHLKQSNSLKNFFRYFKISINREKRVFRELSRKSFHLIGLLIPMIFYMGLKFQLLNQLQCIMIMGTLTLCLYIVEILRVTSLSFRRWYCTSFGSVMRAAERDETTVKLTGMSFFFTGNTLAMILFPPSIATAASLYLVLGDLVAAIVGISYGQIKIGRKSLEGSLAMLCTCCLIGFVLFWHVHLAEYVIVVGAIAATLTELLMPNWIDDNLSIPIVSGIVLQIAFNRLQEIPPFP